MKIYIVKAEELETGKTVVSEVFTNKKLAKACEQYWNNVEKEGDQKWIYYVIDYNISKFDYQQFIK